jgi:16S rRNA (guanine966-N2)-methyltransferase
LFNILGQGFSGEKILDLFSGTGALSIEALSRGASSAVLVELAPEAIRAIRKNLDATGFGGCARLYEMDAERALGVIARDYAGNGFDIVFMGPPYAYRNEEWMMGEVARLGLICPDGVLVIQHAFRRTLPDCAGGMYRKDTRKFGDTSLSFYSLNPLPRSGT